MPMDGGAEPSLAALDGRREKAGRGRLVERLAGLAP